MGWPHIYLCLKAASRYCLRSTWKAGAGGLCPSGATQTLNPFCAPLSPEPPGCNCSPVEAAASAHLGNEPPSGPGCPRGLRKGFPRGGAGPGPVSAATWRPAGGLGRDGGGGARDSPGGDVCCHGDAQAASRAGWGGAGGMTTNMAERSRTAETGQCRRRLGGGRGEETPPLLQGVRAAAGSRGRRGPASLGALLSGGREGSASWLRGRRGPGWEPPAQGAGEGGEDPVP